MHDYHPFFLGLTSDGLGMPHTINFGSSCIPATFNFDIPFSMSLGLTAQTLAEATNSSAPLPGIHPAITSLDSSLTSIDTSTKPASLNEDSRSPVRGAPVTQAA